jgi:hypothetical protein
MDRGFARRCLLRTVAVLGLGACADVTAVDVQLVPDLNINEPTSLARSLDQLRITLDASDNQDLYPDWPPGTDRRIADVDGDGRNEFRVELPINRTDPLPTVRIERGTLRLAPFSISILVDGIGPWNGEALALAAGGISGISFVDGVRVARTIRFNTRPKYLPPRVERVIPDDGGDFSPESVNYNCVFIGFTKPMNPDSLRDPKTLKSTGVIEVVQLDSAKETTVGASRIEVKSLGVSGNDAAYYFFEAPLGAGTYRIKVNPRATDEAGTPLDQVPLDPGAQGFYSHFFVSKELAAATLPTCTPNCFDPAWCGGGGEQCPAGMRCNKASSTCEPVGCPPTCPSGMVCDEKTGVCVTDCRVYGEYGLCEAPAPTCLPSGVCGARP